MGSAGINSMQKGVGMSDPNATYKAGFRELTELLGRTPTSADSGWLALHEEYKSAWLPAEETVLAPKVSSPKAIIEFCAECGFKRDIATGIHDVSSPTTRDCERMYPKVSAAGPGDTGFSRKPAPQAGAIGADTRTREGVPDLMAALERSLGMEPPSGPGINANGAGAASEPEPPSSNCGPAEGPQRGPGGGLLATCEECGRLWERPARRGRPAVRCEECRG